MNTPCAAPTKLPHSPCVNICTAGPDGVCSGCGRTLQEISDWLRMDDARRRAVWQRLLAQGWQPVRGISGRARATKQPGRNT